MSNLRDQLLKAGLVSQKQAKQAAHSQRVERKELGEETIAEARARTEEEARQAAEEKRGADREREERRRAEQAEQLRQEEATRAIVAGWIRDATAGNRRYYFLTDATHISYLDLSDQAVRRLNSGTAAIVETRGVVRGQFCVVDQAAAAILAKNHGERIRSWARELASRPPGGAY